MIYIQEAFQAIFTLYYAKTLPTVAAQACFFFVEKLSYTATVYFPKIDMI
jgi:hypothetical protein